MKINLNSAIPMLVLVIAFNADSNDSTTIDIEAWHNNDIFIQLLQ